MSTPNEFFDDPLDDLLRGRQAQTKSNEGLRTTVYRRTVGAIRFRLRVKKCVFALSLAACYFAGIATMNLRSTSNPESPKPFDARLAIEADLNRTRRPASALPVKITREEYYRREGDRLLAKGDMKQAIREYELALNLASAKNRSLSPREDTWLMMALKNSRSKKEMGK
jgi:hypothetical protein